MHVGHGNLKKNLNINFYKIKKPTLSKKLFGIEKNKQFVKNFHRSLENETKLNAWYLKRRSKTLILTLKPKIVIFETSNFYNKILENIIQT